MFMSILRKHVYHYVKAIIPNLFKTGPFKKMSSQVCVYEL